jgi:hypothetical protein
MSDINTTESVEEIAPIITRKATRTNPVKETEMTVSTAPTTRRLADLTKADKAALVRIFGALPEGKAVALVGRKGDAKTQPECECGCLVVCPSRFISGHDASLHSALDSIVKGEEPGFPGSRGIAVRGWSKAKAQAELAKRGW